MRRSLLFKILVLIPLIFQCSDGDKHVYMFSYFKGNGEDGLHLAYSYDGLKWTALDNDQSLLKPTVGKDKLMRDPCIISDDQGTFHMVWTVSWGEKGIGYASSGDLINWSEQQYIPVMEHESDALNCWAPEVFFDEAHKQFLIMWATTIPGRFPATDDQDNSGIPGKGYNHRMYYVTTKDFKTFSDTRIFYDDGFNVIDATLIKKGSEYIMFLKDETNKPFTPQKNIRVARSDQAVGPYGPAAEPITGDYWAEGPTIIKMDNRWHLYFDKYVLGKYGLLVSTDLKSWTEKSDELEYPDGMRHGTVFRVSEQLFMSLKNANYTASEIQ